MFRLPAKPLISNIFNQKRQSPHRLGFDCCKDVEQLDSRANCAEFQWCGGTRRDLVTKERSTMMRFARYCFCAFTLFAGLGQALAADSGLCGQVKNPGARDLCLAARTEYSNKHYKLALSMMQNALLEFPKEGAIRVEVARTLLQLEGQAQAERELRQARLDGARDQDVLPLLFEAMLDKHEEITLLNEFPDPAPDATGDVAAAILQGRAMALRATSSIAEAAAAMDRALALKRTPRGLLVRADIASSQGDAALTKHLINQAYWMAPDNSEIMSRQLDQRVLANDMAGVIALADRMQKFYPASSVPVESKVAIFLKRNMDASAKAEVDDFLAARPKAPVMLYYRAVLLSRARDKTEASEIIMSLPTAFPNTHPQFAGEMARIVEQDGHAEVALLMLGKALSVAPDMLDVRLQLAALRLQQDSPQSAMTLLTPVQEQHDPRIQNLIAQIHARIAKDRAF
jgi:predicted Zn-dependent protease